MYILGIDSTSKICAVSLWRDTQKISSCYEEIERGHASILPTMLDRVLSQSNVAISDIDKIIVNKGPGTFTGIRISLAFALGLSFALKKSIIAINSFNVLRFGPASQGLSSGILVINGGRPDRYVQTFSNDTMSEPMIMTLDEISQSGVNIISNDDNQAFLGAEALIEALHNGAPQESPAPFYLRPPDVTVSNKSI